MGAGRFRAGMGRAGFDPVCVVPPASQQAYPAAIRFDPATRAFPLDGSGKTIEVHPVDQKVAMLVGIEYAALASAPSQFNRLRALLTRVPSARKPAIARQELNRVLRDLIIAGDIRINDVSVISVGRGADQVGLNYTNLRTNVTPPTLQVA